MAAPKPLPALSDADIARFWSKVDVRGSDECWLWKASCFKGGYGQFKASGRMLKANRVAYFLGTGMDLGESLALHTCDNPPCCNPAHVYGGTAKDNITDAITRGRFACGVGETHGSRTHPESRARGERVGNAKFTAEQVADMRALYLAGGHTHQSFADQFGVTREAIRDMLRGDNWGHIPTDRSAVLAMGQANKAMPGEKNPSAKLNANRVREIRQRYAGGGETYVTLAEAFGVSPAAIRFVVTRRTWQHVA